MYLLGFFFKRKGKYFGIVFFFFFPGIARIFVPEAACTMSAALVTLQFQGRKLKSHLKHV